MRITLVINVSYCKDLAFLRGKSMKVRKHLYTAISRKVVGKSARDNPEWYCGWFFVHCSSKKFERMTRGAMDICLRVLKESKNSRNSILIISHITCRDCRVYIFSTTFLEIAVDNEN